MINRIMTHINSQSKNAIWRYYAYSFLASLHFSGAVLVPFFTDWGGITKTEMQLLQSWFMLWIFLLEVPTGAVADRFGRRISVIIGAIITAIAAILYGTFPNLAVFFLSEFLFAAGIAFISGADSALLYDVLKSEGREKESKHVFARSHSISLAGLFLSSIIGVFLYKTLGLNAPMYMTALPLFLAAIVMWGIPERKIEGEETESKRYIHIAINGFKFIRQNEKLQRAALDAILVASGAYFVIWLYQQLLEKAGIPIVWYGFIHAGLVASEVLVSANFVWLEKLAGSMKRYLRISALITGISFIAVALVPSPIVIILFIVLAGGFGLTRLELMASYFHTLIPSRERATVMSFVSMFRRVFLVLLNPIVGASADFSLPMALVIAGIFPLVTGIFSPLKESKKENE